MVKKTNAQEYTLLDHVYIQTSHWNSIDKLQLRKVLFINLQLPIAWIIKCLSQSWPLFALLIRHDNPDNKFNQKNTKYIKQNTSKYTIFNLVYYINIGLVVGFPLNINESWENTHHISWSTDIGFIVKLVHELRLRSKLWIRNRISPFINHNQYKSSDYGS